MSDEPSNAASEFYRRVCAFLSDREVGPPEEVVRAGLTDDFAFENRRSGVRFPSGDAESSSKIVLSNWQTGAGKPRWELKTLAVRGERFAAVAIQQDYGNGMLSDGIMVIGLDANLRLLQRVVDFDIDDVDRAIAELDHLQAEDAAD